MSKPDVGSALQDSIGFDPRIDRIDIRWSQVRPRESPRRWTVGLTLLFAHVPIAILMKQVPTLATIHALLVVILGLFWGAKGQIERVAYLGAYIAGSDVLWRMCGAQVFWEMGK